MNEYFWSAWFHAADGGIVFIRGGAHRSEQSKAGAREEIKQLVASQFPMADADDIRVNVG